jgi:hypothetical protein
LPLKGGQDKRIHYGTPLAKDCAISTAVFMDSFKAIVDIAIFFCCYQRFKEELLLALVVNIHHFGNESSSGLTYYSINIMIQMKSLSSD